MNREELKAEETISAFNEKLALELSTFNDLLVKEQESIGLEFQKVLYDNLKDLLVK